MATVELVNRKCEMRANVGKLYSGAAEYVKRNDGIFHGLAEYWASRPWYCNMIKYPPLASRVCKALFSILTNAALAVAALREPWRETVAHAFITVLLLVIIAFYLWQKWTRGIYKAKSKCALKTERCLRGLTPCFLLPCCALAFLLFTVIVLALKDLGSI